MTVPKMQIQKYNASKGTEFFISYESHSALYGFLRLRFNSKEYSNGIFMELQESALNSRVTRLW